MDALSDVLRVVKLSGGVFLHAEFTAPWCLFDQMTGAEIAALVPWAGHAVLYHYIVDGSMSVRVGEGAPVTLRAGDAVMLPRNDLHIIGSDLNLTPVRSHDIVRPGVAGGLATIRHGGGGAPCHIVCGYLAADRADGNPLFAALPPILPFYASETPGADWIRSMFQFAANEIAAGRPGSDSVLAKLSELLFVEAVRRYVETLPPEQTGWLAGLRDPHVARALALIHGRLAEPWTVDELSREVGVSRSVLAEKFARLIGEPPMAYLARWRINVAAHHLQSSQMTLARIAEQVGYESEAAFNRSFRRMMGLPPGAWRKRHHGGAAPAAKG